MKSSLPCVALVLGSFGVFGSGACQAGLQPGDPSAGSANDDGSSGGSTKQSGGASGEAGGRKGDSESGGAKSAGGSGDDGTGGRKDATGGTGAGARTGGGGGGGNDGSGGSANVCEPDKTRPCYEGPPSTRKVGACRDGTETCLPDGSGYGPCTGQVLPTHEICENSLDDDCDGRVDFGDDADGDGWAFCLGDCCDDEETCDDPASVNVGAFEVSGNGIDEDCDGNVDDVSTTCDAGLSSNSLDAVDFAHALDLCRRTSESPPTPRTRTWGVVFARFLRSDSIGTPSPDARAIRASFGTNNLPKLGSGLVVLSTGTAAAPGETNPAHTPFDPGTDFGLTSTPPSDWLALNRNHFPTVAGCPTPSASVVHDPILYELRLRVPTNAHSFQFWASYFSADFPESICSGYSDYFLVLLTSEAENSPSDHDLA